MSWITRLALAAGLLAVASQAEAQSYVSSMCRAYVSDTGLHFDSAEHGRWYKRFWTGECDHLFGCLPGEPNWNDVAARIVARGAPGQRDGLQTKACRLGQRIGLEWSREHDVRHITTRDLQRYRSLMRDGDAGRGLEAVERAVDQDMKGRSPGAHR